MKNTFKIFLLLNIASINFCFSQSIRYVKADTFDIIGQLPNCTGFNRLPDSSFYTTRTAIYNLSKFSTGLGIRFKTNSSILRIKWSLLRNSYYAFMAPTAVKGFDLYSYQNNKWQYAGVALPSGKKDNDTVIISNMTSEEREFLLNLPLYDEITNLEIGIDVSATISKSTETIIDTINPIIFYGTSITQGASASRPGMTYCGLLARELNKEIINLGFSGNGFFETEIAKYFMTANPSLLFLDCTPNSPPDTILKNLPLLVEYVKSINDTLPIIFMESIVRENSFYKTSSTINSLDYIRQQNQTLRDVFDQLSKTYTHLYYISSENIIGKDHEGTVDGVHLNDLGIFRMYKTLSIYINDILNLPSGQDSAFVSDTIYHTSYDTIRIQITDTIHYIIKDTTYETVYDTTHILINDTTHIQIVDTVNYVITDTLYQTIYDTTHLLINDTTRFVVYDTLFITVTDSSFITIFDTTNIIINDTARYILYDTVHISITDTLFIKFLLAEYKPDNFFNTIKIFPNPATTVLYINTGNFSLISDYKIIITNPLSQVIFTTFSNQPLYEIDLTKWTSRGIYHIQILDAAQKIITTREIVIQ
ncbi:MAG: hypothetical protein A3G23_04410 [Bacteroidetes bacterium RIFCSPLOWO2_12_FULL_37_12]|nr:MAG: hypothetical protein A3G23_04410 [Bacteroidetes bacterium RIFCSPLOWO2_12_FULL_37_12]